MKRLLKKK
ncbi:Protein of unknown function [Bacillus cytotoxicus]|nr:Protein of unknown function [Bacillus cytotoxicus]